MWLFRASPFASVCVVHYLESELSDIPRHLHPHLPGGRLKSRKYKKPPLAVKKSPACAGTKKITLLSICRRHIDRRTQTAVFLPPKADFFTGTGRFLNHAGCCRHAKHGVGKGGDDKEENSFSDCRHRLPLKGEADNIRHGFLCLYQPIT